VNRTFDRRSVIVCHCKAATDRDIVAAIAAGAADEFDVAEACGAGTGCGGCLPAVTALLATCRPLDPPLLETAAYAGGVDGSVFSACVSCGAASSRPSSRCVCGRGALARSSATFGPPRG
jgi:bacterioferritin-associated ferredoxin